MARRPDTPCAGGCGTLLWGGRGSLDAGQRCCRTCRNAGRNPVPRLAPTPKPVRTCDEAGCEGKHLARGMCRAHYRRWQWANSPEVTSLTDVLLSMASLHGAYLPKVKPVKARITVGVMVDCPACPDIMTAINPVDRFCKSCGTTLTLNSEEVSWLTSQARSRRASLRTAS